MKVLIGLATGSGSYAVLFSELGQHQSIELPAAATWCEGPKATGRCMLNGRRGIQPPSRTETKCEILASPS